MTRARFIGGSASAAIEWLPLTQAMLTGGTKRTGGADTLKSAAVVDAVITVTANAIAATADGIRETSGIEVPILDVVPTFDPDSHDLVMWLGGPTNSATTMALAIAVCNSPGSSADGVGVIVTGAQTRPQSITASVAPLTGGSVANADAFVRFVFNGGIAGGEVCASVWRVDADGPAIQAATTDDVNLSDLDAVFLYFQAASYSGAQSENATASATVHFAAVPKLTEP